MFVSSPFNTNDYTIVIRLWVTQDQQVAWWSEFPYSKPQFKSQTWWFAFLLSSPPSPSLCGQIKEK